MPVLIVDDSQTNQIVMETLLHALGAREVAAFQDPLEALQWVGEGRPDLIIIDYLMPQMDGISLIRKIRQIEQIRHTPIIMVTTTDLKRVRIDALDAGATDFISRPIDPLEFKVRARNLLALGEAQARLNDTAAWLTEEVRKKTIDLEDREKEIIFRLSRSVEFRDEETGGHIERMASYSRVIAQALGFSDEYCETLYLAAPLHDVGKLAVADAILLKRGPLTPAERAEMQKHVSYGGAILSDSSSAIMQLAQEIALSHHERWDGNGYPAKLVGEAIPVAGRITALADVFDALTSDRPYKKAWSPEAARDYITSESGKHFDPKCVNAFNKCWEDVLAICVRCDRRGRSVEVNEKTS